MRRVEAHKRKQQARFFAAGQFADWLSAMSWRNPKWPSWARRTVWSAFCRAYPVISSYGVASCRVRPSGAGRSSRCAACRTRGPFRRASGRACPAINFIRVDLPLPFAPSSAMRSSGSMFWWMRRRTGLPSYSRRRRCPDRDQRRRSFSGLGKVNGIARSAMTASTISIFSSALTRLCACAAFDGLGLETVDEGLHVGARRLLLFVQLLLRPRRSARSRLERCRNCPYKASVCCCRRGRHGRRTCSSRSRSCEMISSVCGYSPDIFRAT